MKAIKTHNLFILGFIILGTFSRLVPHLWNFSAVMAVSIFVGREFRDWRSSVLIAIGSMFLADIFLGFYSGMGYVYLAIIMGSLSAFYFKKYLRGFRMMVGTMIGSGIFFIVSNLGVWLSGDLYSKTWGGLLKCYAMAIPFFQNQILGDLFFSSAIVFFFDYLVPRLGMSRKEITINS